MRQVLLAALVVIGCKDGKGIHGDDNLKPVKPPEIPPPVVTADAAAPPPPAAAADPIAAWASVVSAPKLDKAALAALYAKSPHHEDADETQRDGTDAIAGWAEQWKTKYPDFKVEPQIVVRDHKNHGAALVLATGTKLATYGLVAFKFDADNKITFEYFAFDPASPHAAATPLASRAEVVATGSEKDVDAFAFKFEAAWDKQQAKELEAMLADDVEIYDSSMAADIKGKAAAMDYAKHRWKVTPARTSVYKPLWVAGDFVVDVIGWHTDKMKTDLIDAQLVELKDGKIKRYWVVRDTGAVTKALGLK